MRKGLIILLLLVAPGLLVAQRVTDSAPSSSSDSIYNLTVSVNVGNYQLYVNNSRINGNTIKLKEGTYTVKVTAPGYRDYVQVVNMTRDTRLSVRMESLIASYNLQISVNIPDYNIYINNNRYTSNQLNLDEGTYTVKITSNGYKDYLQVINLNRDTRLSIRMIPETFYLSVEPSVSGNIYINNRLVGSNGYRDSVIPGNYEIRIEVPGYKTFIRNIYIDRDTNIFAELIAEKAQVTVYFDPVFLSKKYNNPLNRINIYDNGEKVKDLTFDVTPGNHLITIESGVFVIESNFFFEAGKSYKIVPNFTLTMGE